MNGLLRILALCVFIVGANSKEICSDVIINSKNTKICCYSDAPYFAEPINEVKIKKAFRIVAIDTSRFYKTGSSEFEQTFELKLSEQLNTSYEPDEKYDLDRNINVKITSIKLN